MLAFVFDTETTGLTVKGGTPEQQPYIVHFAWILGKITAEKGFEEIEILDQMIKPKIPIPFGASQVHHIYDKDVENCPPIEAVIDRILHYLNTTPIIVGHNIEFDEDVVRGELARLHRKGDYQPIKTLCTMRGSTDYCKLMGRGFSYKPPKLNELYRHLFGEWFEGSHNAVNDVRATAVAFGELVKRGVIKLEETNVMRLF